MEQPTLSGKLLRGNDSCEGPKKMKDGPLLLYCFEEENRNSIYI